MRNTPPPLPAHSAAAVVAAATVAAASEPDAALLVLVPGEERERRGRGKSPLAETVSAHACRQRERRGRVWVACGGGAPKSASFNDDTLPFVSAHSIPVNLLGERMCTVRLVRFHELDLFRSRRHTRPVIIKMDGRSRRSSRRRRWRLCGRCFQRFLLIALLRFALRGRLLLGHLRGIEEDSRCWIYQFTWFQDISNSDCGPSTHLAIGAAVCSRHAAGAPRS